MTFTFVCVRVFSHVFWQHGFISEFEAVDVEKEKYKNEELLPRVDDYIVKVARKRKLLPRACRAAVTGFANSQATYLVWIEFNS